MIPEAAVEAAARAWCGTDDLRNWQRRHITKLLEAAAPHMLPSVKWPDHGWVGDAHGHACSSCEEASPWYCDRVAHKLGEVDRSTT